MLELGPITLGLNYKLNLTFPVRMQLVSVPRDPGLLG